MSSSSEVGFPQWAKSINLSTLRGPRQSRVVATATSRRRSRGGWNHEGRYSGAGASFIWDGKQVPPIFGLGEHTHECYPTTFEGWVRERHISTITVPFTLALARKYGTEDKLKIQACRRMDSHAAKGWASECPDVKNYKWRLNPVWH